MPVVFYYYIMTVLSMTLKTIRNITHTSTSRTRTAVALVLRIRMFTMIHHNRRQHMCDLSAVHHRLVMITRMDPYDSLISSVILRYYLNRRLTLSTSRITILMSLAVHTVVLNIRRPYLYLRRRKNSAHITLISRYLNTIHILNAMTMMHIDNVISTL